MTFEEAYHEILQSKTDVDHLITMLGLNLDAALAVARYDALDTVERAVTNNQAAALVLGEGDGTSLEEMHLVLRADILRQKLASHFLFGAAVAALFIRNTATAST